MVKASIDIGTNSVLLLVAEVSNGAIRVLEERSEVPRLGKGVDNDKSLHPDSQERVLKVLKGYQSHLEAEYSLTRPPMITATSAVRDASNREEFLTLIKRETGWGVMLLSGLMEAETTFSGALSVLENLPQKHVSVLDIGGGSTEIAVGNPSELDHSISLDIGSVRFSERFLKSNPPTLEEIENMKEEIRIQLAKLKSDSIPEQVVGVAGTVTSIAAIDSGLKAYEPEKLNGYLLNLEEIKHYLLEFSTLTAEEIEKRHPVFLKNRGDVIVAGLQILAEYLRFVGHDHIIVSTGGIRHGILLQ